MEDVALRKLEDTFEVCGCEDVCMEDRGREAWHVSFDGLHHPLKEDLSVSVCPHIPFSFGSSLPPRLERRVLAEELDDVVLASFLRRHEGGVQGGGDGHFDDWLGGNHPFVPFLPRPQDLVDPALEVDGRFVMVLHSSRSVVGQDGEVRKPVHDHVDLESSAAVVCMLDLGQDLGVDQGRI